MSGLTPGLPPKDRHALESEHLTAPPLFLQKASGRGQLLLTCPSVILTRGLGWDTSEFSRVIPCLSLSSPTQPPSQLFTPLLTFLSLLSDLESGEPTSQSSGGARPREVTREPQSTVGAGSLWQDHGHRTAWVMHHCMGDFYLFPG